MTRKDTRILVLAEDGPDTAELISNLIMNIDADFAHVGSIEEAREAADSGDYDVVIAMSELPDGNGVELLDPEAGRIDAPVVLIDDELAADRLVQALRSGAADVLATPIDYGYLVDSVRRIVRQRHMGRQELIRTKRLRRLSSRLVKDRREMRKRVDLICNDIVTAYQRLAEKFVAVMEPGDSSSTGGDEFSLQGEE
ncbi:MAG: response regulator [Phycisphaerae bacterium]|nr:response regulator [Phycisphaerae bacterium]